MALTRWGLHSLSARITAGVVLAVLVIGGGSFWVLQAFYRRQMIQSLADSTTVQGKLVEQSLRYAMHTRSLDLLAEMVRGFAAQRGVEKVMILNKAGAIRFSSDSAERGQVLAASDPTCRICHRERASDRSRTVILEAGGRQVFRNVNPILNGETCFGCHPAQDRINGVLIVDYSLSGLEASLAAGARKMWLAALTLALVITGVVVLLLRRLVLRRLGALVRVVDALEAGRMERSVDTVGADEISALAGHLNRMASSLDQSLRDLRERQAFLDAVINSADDGIVVVDKELRTVTCNRAFEALLGSQQQERAEGRCQCTVPCAAGSAGDCPALRTFATGEVTRSIRSVIGPDAIARSFEVSASPLRDAGDGPRVIEVWRDITHRRELEAKLASSERLASLGLLASGVAHEVNNPLATIATCLDGLQRRLRSGDDAEFRPELEEYLRLIRSEVTRCSDLTNRLKLLGAKPKGIAQPLDLAAVVRETLALVRYQAEERGITIEETLPANLGPVLAEESQLRQVVLNLLLNGIQAIDGAGRLAVTAHPDGDEFVVMEVADSGRGIEPSDLPQIFEPFYSARPDGRGTGLGLFICRVIVDQLGGAIGVDSGPGIGARFTVRLPGGIRAGLGALS